jgi:hypothetical protein
MADKVIIELEPYNALAILRFCREFVTEEEKEDYRFRAIYS